MHSKSGQHKHLAIVLLVFTINFCLVAAEECDDPGETDTVPVISQLKSLFQYLHKDTQGAKCTLKHFVNGTPVLSQLKSVVQATKGDFKGAKRTQEKFAKAILRIAEETPGVGHVLGAGHYIAGNKDKGEEVLKDATRAAAVLVGTLGAGPWGAIAARTAYDGAVSVIYSAMKGKRQHYGVFDIAVKIEEISKASGNHFDAAASLVLDAFGDPGTSKKRSK